MSTQPNVKSEKPRVNRTLTVSLDDSLRKEVQRAAAESHMTTSGYLAMILKSFPDGLPRVQHQLVYVNQENKMIA